MTTMNSDLLFEHIACPLCGSDDHEEAYACVNYVSNSLKRVTIRNVLCRACGFLFANPCLKEDVLKDYYAGYSSGGVFHESHADSRCGRMSRERKEFIERHLGGERPGRYLDVGCGQGDLLRLLHLDHWKKDGLEPLFAARAVEMDGITLFPEYLEDFEPGEAYDAIGCYSVFEHLRHPRRCLQKMRRLLRDEGLLFLEVPDTRQPEPQISEYFSFEHVSYFTERTLTAMLSLCGFEVVEFDRNVNFSNLRCVSRKGEAKEPDLGQGRDELVSVVERYKTARLGLIRQVTDMIRKDLEECRNDGRRIAIYGAGAHTLFLFEIFDLDAMVEYVIDSDPRKQGTRFLRWTIQPPEAIAGMDAGAILISSHNFQDEIHATIRKHNTNGIKVIRCYG